MLFRTVRLALFLLVSLAVTGPAWAQERLPESALELRLSYAPLVKKTAPAVVNIYTQHFVRQRRVMPLFNDPFFRRFFEGFSDSERESVQNSLGSGVIVDAGGLIVTNHHVVEGASEIRIVLTDRREFEAKLVAQDADNDLAILQVQPGEGLLPTLTFGNSDDLEVGDLVLAIGNPFGVGQTVTSGIISANARSTARIGDGGVFIQTDAAINPGNSGGALVDMDGRLVGVNTAIFSRSGGSHGIGFAIPANLVLRMVIAHQRGERLIRPWIGAEGEPVNHEMASTLGMPRPQGVILSDLHPQSPLAEAGLRPKDILMTVARKPVDDIVTLRFRFETAPGRSVPVTFMRSGAAITQHVRIVPPPEEPPRNETVLSGNTPLNGVRVINVSPAVIQEFELQSVKQGVLITDVHRGSTARRVGFRPGDVVEQINGDVIERINQLKSFERRPPRYWEILFRRDGKRLRLELRG